MVYMPKTTVKGIFCVVSVITSMNSNPFSSIQFKSVWGTFKGKKGWKISWFKEIQEWDTEAIWIFFPIFTSFHCWCKLTACLYIRLDNFHFAEVAFSKQINAGTRIDLGHYSYCTSSLFHVNLTVKTLFILKIRSTSIVYQGKCAINSSPRRFKHHQSHPKPKRWYSVLCAHQN